MGDVDMFVIYKGNGEVLVTTLSREDACIETWFTNSDRVLDEYDRNEAHELESCVCIVSELKLDNVY